MHKGSSALAHHFESIEQQHGAHSVAMWAFVAQEVMFFGGLFAAYMVYRMSYPGMFEAGSHHLDVTIGAANTAVLLGSSFTMVLAVRAAHLGSRNGLIANLIATMGLGAVFLGVKAVEYYAKYEHHLIPGWSFVVPAGEPSNLEMFFLFYFIMTGAHAFHMILGMFWMLYLLYGTLQGRYMKDDYSRIECTGLYWHFVDIVWIFLFPLLYLLGRHG